MDDTPLLRKIPPPFGVVRDVLAFYNALVPKNKTSAAPRALVPLVDTVLLAKGRPTRWLCTGDSGESTEKLSVDREAMLRVFVSAGAFFDIAWGRLRGSLEDAVDLIGYMIWTADIE